GDERDLAREIEELHAHYLPVPVPTDPRRRGSRVSRRPSPRRFRLSPATVKVMPGKRLTQNASRMTFFPLAMTLPHEGTYGGTPTPRKPKMAPARPGHPKMNVPWTRRGARQFGRICRNATEKSGRPSARAAAT